MSQIFNVLSIRTDAASQAQIHLRRTFVTFAHENISQQTSHEIIVNDCENYFCETQIILRLQVF